MLPLLEGRVDRKTFIIGSAVGLAILIAVIIVFIVPVGLIDIVINQSHKVNFKPVYYILLLPAVVYAFYFCVLAVKRAHDCGFPGVPLLILLGLLEIFIRVSDLLFLNLLIFGALLLLGIFPGQKTVNKFGPPPHKRFRFANLRL